MLRSLLVAAAFLVPAAFAQDAGNCKVLDPELQGMYAGGCRNGLADGEGEARGSAAYTGEFKAGLKHGSGIKTWPSGDRYEGQFADDRKTGKGLYVWGSGSASAGEQYSGEWLDDRRHGHGVYEWPNGDRYEGAWKNDRIAGPPTRAMIARARIEAERTAAVGQPGAKVCRKMTVGIVTPDWVRGTVQSLEGGRLRVRIDDAGKFEHVIGGNVITNGDVISDAPGFWVPCL